MPKSLLMWAAAMMSAGFMYANPAAAYDRHLDIVNNSDETIMEFHASNIGQGRWGPDLLGSTSIGPGDDTYLNLNDHSGYCHFDFLTIMADGSPIVRPDVNVCQVATYTIE